MNLGAQSMLVLILIAVCGMASGVFVVARHLEKPGARGFAVAISGAAGWSLVVAIDMVAYTAIPLFVSITARSIFVFALSLGWLLFVVEYVRHEQVRLTSPVVALLLVVPVVSIGLTITNPVHNLVLGVESTRGPFGGLNLVYGPWYYVYLSFTYLVTLPGVGLLLLEYRSAHSIYRRQLLLVIGGFAIAFVGASDYLLFRLVGDVPSYFRLTPFSYLVTTGLWLAALFQHQLFNVVPISRWTVVETLSDPIVAVDPDGRIVDSNPAATRLGSPSIPAVGATFTEFFASHPTLVEQFQRSTSATELELTHDGETRQYLLMRKPIDAKWHGAVIVLRDITTLRTREQQLLTKNEQLERLANVVSHDLQTPILTAQKLLTVLRMDLSDNQDSKQSLDNLEAVHDRLSGFAENLPRLARESTDVEEPIEWELSTTANAAWKVVDTGSLSLTIKSTNTYRGDPARVQQVFENLFQNTARHATSGARSHTDLQPTEDENYQLPTNTSDGPRVDNLATNVRVGTYEQGFFVEDDGPGIDPNLREHILEYGMSTDGGSGFGLAIVRTIIEAHGWELSVTESSTGGARFEIRTTDWR